MNLLLLDPADFQGDDRVVVRGRRAAHIASVVRPKAGDELVIGVVDGPQGVGVVLASAPDELVLEPRLDRSREPVPEIDLLLALPRPKVMRRLLADIASLGVGTLHLTNAWRVERAYFASPVLAPEAVDTALRRGLEQARATYRPRVEIHHRLMAFLDETLPSLAPGARLLAHPNHHHRLTAADVAGGRVLIAIGPEGGWIEREVATFVERGFTPFTAGPRVLRTEAAVPAIYGGVAALRGGLCRSAEIARSDR
jgi:16S rRNA (uracil1498-N3)-methyltransferase